MNSPAGQSGKRAEYAAYKPSGMEWIGDIPEHWEVRRLKTVAGFGYGDSLAADDRVAGPYKVYGSNGIVDQHDRANTQSPCLIIGRKGSFGKVAFSDKPCFAIDTTYFVDSRLTAANLRWLYYSLQWLRLDSISKDSAVPGLSREDAYDNRLAFCPLDEQQAIAAFLDRETARIDALIEKKQRQIELLQEKRSALISHAVTKGLDPDAKMRDSGIEWLGEIPAHWDLPPLYARYSVELGKMLDAKRFTGKYLLPYLRNIDVQWDRVNVEDLPEMDIEPNEFGRFTLADGDLLVCEGGEVGRTAMWSGELSVCAFQKAIHRVRPRSNQDVPRFYYYIMRAAAWSGVFLAYGNPNTIPHLTAEKLRVYRFPFPPHDEQNMIVQHLDFETQRIDALVAKVKTSIDKLKEFRIALISAAVTGKIDVRKEVP